MVSKCFIEVDKEKLLEKLSTVYEKIKGSIFLRIVPSQYRFFFHHEDFLVEKENPGRLVSIKDEEEETFCFMLRRDMSFSEWLKVKRIHF